MKLRYLFITLLILCSCNRINHKQLQIDPKEWKESGIKLSEIADNISYLQMDNTFPFRAAISATPVITRNFIVVFIAGTSGIPSTTGIVKYDRIGKLIGKIGNWGRGPEEYMSDRFAIDDETGEAYILINGDRIKLYSKTGRYTRTISLGKFGSFRRIELYNNKLFAFDFPGIGPSKYYWIVIDTLGNIIKTKENSLSPFVNLIASSYGNTYKYNNKLFYWSTFNDTVFSISPDLSTRTNILFAQGPYRWPASDFSPSESTDISGILANHLIPFYLFETKRFFVFYYTYQNNYPVAFIDKRNGEGRITASKNTLNDIDGGIIFHFGSSRYFAENGYEYIAGFIEAFNLKAHVSSETFKSSYPRYPEKKKELVKLAASLKETDNPVLMIVRLKR